MIAAGKRVLVMVSGGIAAYKTCILVRRLLEQGCEVRVAMSARAREFVTPLTFEALSRQPVIVDTWGPGEAMEHIAGAEWADCAVVAPATANTIAKFAHGFGDDILGTLFLALEKPVILAPAMNTAMWNHPATQENLQTLLHRGVQVVAPGTGVLACRTVGPGKMEEPESLVEYVLDVFQGRPDLRGERILVTAGPTQEHLDPFRFISNPSSGRMGVAIANAAHRAGAEVQLIHGPLSVPLAGSYPTRACVSAAEMKACVEEHFPGCTALIMAAAVADFCPATRHEHKLKKDSGLLDHIQVQRTPDILAGVARLKEAHQVVVGFSAESRDLVENSTRKLLEKALDLVVANPIGGSDVGFRSGENRVTLIRAGAEPREVATMPKDRVAVEILKEIAALRRWAAAEAPAGPTDGAPRRQA